MRERKSYPCTPEKAGKVLFAVLFKKWSQTQAAIVLELNSGTVSKIVNGLRFPNAKPIPF